MSYTLYTFFVKKKFHITPCVVQVFLLSGALVCEAEFPSLPLRTCSLVCGEDYSTAYMVGNA